MRIDCAEARVVSKEDGTTVTRDAFELNISGDSHDVRRGESDSVGRAPVAASSGVADSNGAWDANGGALLAELVEQSQDALIIRDIAGIIRYMNPAAETLYGYTADEARGKSVHDLFQSQFPGGREAYDAALLRDGRWAGEIVQRRSDGAQIIVSSRQTVRRAIDGDSDIVLASNRDVSEEHRSTQRLRRLFDSHVVGVIYWNLDTGAITDANDHFLSMVGYTREDLSAGLLNFREMTPPEWMERNEEGVSSLRARGFAPTYEKEYIRKDGSRMPILIGGTRFEESGIEGFSFVLDNTEQRSLNVEQVRLYAKVQIRADREGLLSEATRLLNSSLDSNETLATVSRLIVPRFADWCMVDIVDDSGNPQRVAVERVDPEKASSGRELRRRYPMRMEDTQGIAAVLRTGRSYFLPQVTDEMLVAGVADPERLRSIRELGFTSVMIVPLAVRERILGAISFLATVESGRTFGEDDLRFAEEIGQRAAFAVENARLYRRMREAAERQQFLFELTEKARRLTDPDAVIEETARSVGEFLSLSRYLYAEVDETNSTITVHHDWNDTKAGVKGIQGTWDFESWIHEVAPFGVTRADLRETQIGVVSDFAADSRNPPEYNASALNASSTRMRAVVRIPLYRDGQWVAMLSAQCREPRDWSEEDVALLETIAERTWLTLENLRLLREAQGQALEQRARAEREALLNKIGADVRASLEPDAILKAAVTALGQGLGADRCYFVRYSQARDIARVSPEWIREGLRITSIAGRNLQMSSFSVDRDESYKAGATHVVNDVVAYSPDEAESLVLVDIRSLLRVPIEVGDVMTAIAVSMAYETRIWTQDEVQLVENVAALLHAALESALMQQRERNIAQQLQDALQPPIPGAIPGLALASHYSASLGESQVGGDVSDAYDLGNGRHCLLVADLAGKGLSAASQVALVRNQLRYALYTADFTRPGALADAVRTLNSVIFKHRLLSGFATMFVGVWDDTSSTMTYVNAGQEPALIWRSATGCVEMLHPTGPVLGGFEDAEFLEESVKLEVGDLWTAFSDGMTEIGENRRELLGIDGVVPIFAGCCASSRSTGSVAEPDRILKELISGVVAFARGTGMRDDLCALVGVRIPTPSGKSIGAPPLSPRPSDVSENNGS